MLKKRMAGIVSAAVLTIAYGIVRYPLFEWHGMKEFPLYLWGIGMIVIVVAGFIRGTKVLPFLTLAGYVIGFAAGAVFQYDYGEGLNNLWIIWMWCFLVSILLGLVWEIALRKKRTNPS